METGCQKFQVTDWAIRQCTCRCIGSFILATMMNGFDGVQLMPWVCDDFFPYYYLTPAQLTTLNAPIVKSSTGTY